jgi:serine protease Do
VPATESQSAVASSGDNVLSGIEVTDFSSKTRQKLKLDSTVAGGVVVSSVERGSVAEDKGIEAGDVIESACVERGATQPITNAKAFEDLANGLKPDQSVVLLVQQEKGSSFVYLAPQAR